MTETLSLYDLTAPVTKEELDAGLLDMTGDLEKAQVLHHRLPHWMVEAPPHTLAAVEQAYLDSELPRKKLKELLNRLQPLDEFCASKLEQFLTLKGYPGLNVHRDYLERKRKLPLKVMQVTGILLEQEFVDRRSLIQAAMQNFSADEAEPESLLDGSAVRRGEDNSVVPGITALQYVKYCRALDLGSAYQAHVRQVFSLPEPGETPLGLGFNTAAVTVAAACCADMAINLRIALAKQHISQATHDQLLKLINADLPAHQLAELMIDDNAPVWEGLKIGKSCLWSVLVFSAGETETSEEASETVASKKLIVYMPGEPGRPWYEYPALEDFQQYLTAKLQVKSYRQTFGHYLSEAERQDFLSQFEKNKTLGRLELVPATGNFSDFFFRSYIGKLQQDAQVLAVPKAEVDEEARQERLLGYINVGLDILNLAAFVVPGLGQLMMGVAIGQLLGEVFDGVEDWSHGDNAEALKHLISVAENIAGMMLFAAGGRVVGSLKRNLKSSAGFFDPIEAVKLQDGSARLWRPRLSSYRQQAELAEPWVHNSRGVYQANGRSYIQIEGHRYLMGYDEKLGQWRINHPTRSRAYRPVLEHNFKGGWQHDFERPHSWKNPQYVLQRIDPRLAGLPSDALQQIAAINEMDLPALQALAQEHEPLSERFQDAVARFRQHQKVLDLAHALENEHTLEPATARMQMYALPLMRGWPKGRFFEVLNDKGGLLESYPDVAPFDYEDLSIHITEQQLKDGEVMSTLLQALTDEECDLLLGEAVKPEDIPTRLKAELLKTVNDQHYAVHRQLYADYNGIAVGDEAVLCTRFPGLPSRIAKALLSDASSVERSELRQSGRVSLGLEQRSREVMARLAEDQALMGFYWPELASDGTRRLMFGLLRKLPHWPKNLSLQLREGSVRGEMLERAGPPTAAVRRTIVHTDQGFQAFDKQGASLNTRVSGPDALLQAVVDCLSPAERKTMSLTGSDPVTRLRSQLRFKSQDERPRVSRYLSPEYTGLEDEPVVCTPTAPQVRPVAAPEFAPALVRKVKKLYPWMTDTQVSALLEGTGEDALSRARAVDALEKEFKALHKTLKTWASDHRGHTDTSTSPADFRLSRTQARKAIERCWRGMILLKNEEHVEVPGLALDGMHLEALPTLGPDVRFGHVRQLSMRNMRLSDEVAYFLKHFTGLRSLDLAQNQLSRLPEALSNMPDLEHLRLSHNNLQLTEYTRQKLAKMRPLKTLDLAGNPLRDAPDVTQLFDLRELILKDCRLTDFPTGVRRLPYLEQVDLRFNDIRELPNWLLELPRASAQVFNLRSNPLSDASQALLMDYRTRVGTGLGYAADDTARLNEQAAREVWLADKRVAGYAEKDRVWAGLKNEHGSEGFFNLLAELRHTSDATSVREDLTRRVWRVLDETAADAQLREEVFQRAATPINCDDSAAANFSQLEVLVEINHAARGVERGEVMARPLLKLAKGLFRLDKVEALARSHSVEHPSADPLEVSLALRTGLANKFYLPGQPKGMRMRNLANITSVELTKAESDLKSAELSPDLLTFIAQLPFWKKHLKRTYARRFGNLIEPFHQRMDAVFSQRATLQDAEYQRQMNAIKQEQEQVEAAEIRTLTRNSLAYDDQRICERVQG